MALYDSLRNSKIRTISEAPPNPSGHPPSIFSKGDQVFINSAFESNKVGLFQIRVFSKSTQLQIAQAEVICKFQGDTAVGFDTSGRDKVTVNFLDREIIDVAFKDTFATAEADFHNGTFHVPD